MKSEPGLLSEIRKFGHFDTNACMQCGSCTIACDLANNGASFPRKQLRYALFGLKKMIRSGLEPWICYFCGDCSTTCPRETEPGEAMMTLRRYLTSQYDWTGLSKRFYTSKVWELGALFVVGAFMTALILLFAGPMVTERVEVNTFAPPHMVHTFDLILFAVLAFFLVTNAFRMYWFNMHPDSGAKIPEVIKGFRQNGFGYIEHNGQKIKIPLGTFLLEIKTFLIHFFTQKLFLNCKKNIGRWLKHFLLVSGYLLMLFLVVVLLLWFQTDEIYPITHPQRWLGYYATAVLIFTTVEIIIGRIRKREQIHKYSDFSDWLFPILILLTTVSGILLHSFRYLEMPMAAYYTYAVHLVIAVSMLAVEVPFGKWAHLLYRPLGIFLHKVKERALQEQLLKEVVLENGQQQSN